MSTELATVSDKRQPLAKRVATLRDVMMSQKEKLGAGMAGLLTPDTAIQVACNSIRKNPKLLDCTPPSLFGCIAEAGTYGWRIDGVLGEAYMVPFKDQATLIPGYKGLRRLVEKSGEVRVSMESVHEGDEYEYKGRFEMPHHVMSNDPARRFKPVTHAYVIAMFPQTVQAYSWRVGECIAHRDHYSQNWKRKKVVDNPWHEKNPAFRVMCMKTVFLDCIHRGEFPMSIEDRKIAERAVAFSGVPETTLEVAPDLLLVDQSTDVIDAHEQPTPEAPGTESGGTASPGEDEAELIEFTDAMREQFAGLTARVACTELRKKVELDPTTTPAMREVSDKLCNEQIEKIGGGN